MVLPLTGKWIGRGWVGREGAAEFSSRCVEFEETAGAS